MRRESGLPVGVYPSHDEVCSGIKNNNGFNGLTDSGDVCYATDHTVVSGLCTGVIYIDGIRRECFASRIKRRLGGGVCIKK